MSTPGILVLSRDQVRRVATVVEGLKARVRTRDAAAKLIGIGPSRLSAILARPAVLRIVRESLAKIARAAGPLVTVEQLLAGDVELTAAPPAPVRGGGGVIVPRSRRRR